MSNSELSQPEVEIVELKNKLYHAVADFLGRNSEDFSETFMQQFYKIRGDVLSAIPEQVLRYNKEKALAQKNSKKGQIYKDPRAPELSQEYQKELLKHSDFVTLQEGTTKIPENILIRAVIAIKNRSIAALDGKKLNVVGISREQAQAEMEEKRTAKLHNWNHRR